jgi:hypothetical protein
VLGIAASIGSTGLTASAGAACPNAVFRTGPSAKLPDCRAYELVTPRYTAGIRTVNVQTDGQDMFSSQLVSPLGDSVVFETIGGALPGFPGTGLWDQYRSLRKNDGWVTERHGVYAGEAEKTNFGGATMGGEYTFERAERGIQASLWAPWAGIESGSFLRGPDGVEPLGRGLLGDDPDAEGRFISPHATHVVFESAKKLEPAAPADGLKAIYDRTPGGPTHLVSVRPDGSTITEPTEVMQVSPDGEDIAFDIVPGCFSGCNLTSQGIYPMFVRRDNAETIEVLRPNGVVVGKTLTCLGAPTSGATLEYQWLRNGVAIPLATNPTYTVTTADEGKSLQCQVTAVNGEGSTTATSSNKEVMPFASGVLPDVFAYISPTGTNVVPADQMLTCNTNSGGGAPVSYEWLRNGTVVGGASNSTYSPSAGDIGDSFQCRVTVTTPDGPSVGYSYNAVRIVPVIPRATANPVISDVSDPGAAEAAVGDELTCAPGTWKGSPTFSYQWWRDGGEIGGATGSTYVVTAADEEKGIQCAVTGTNASGSTQAVSKSLVGEHTGGPTGLPKHPFLETFGSAEQPTFWHPEGMAVDQATGDLYVIDSYKRTVSRFHADGTPYDFSDQNGSVGGNEIKFVLGNYPGPNEAEVAIDESGGATDGNIYITNESGHLVDVFSSAGTPLGQLTAAGSTNFGEICGLTVDSSGALYVGDYNGKVHKFVASGAYPVNTDNTDNFNYSEACQLAAGAGPTAGYIFVASYGGQLAKMDSSTGEVKYTVATGVTTASVDPSSGYLYAVLGNRFEAFDASGPAAATPVSMAKVSGGQGIAIRGSNGNVYVSSSSGGEVVEVYGPAIPLGPRPPEIVTPGGVNGNPRVGNSLFCEAGRWKGAPESFSRQWLRNGEPIVGATGFSYTTVAEDLGSVIQCRVKATNEEGSAVAVNADEGAIYVVTQGPPLASASIKYQGAGPGFTFDGLFNGKVFWDDSRTNFSGTWQDVPGNLYTIDLDSEDIQTIADTEDAQFVNVSDDGSHVVFTSPSKYNGEGEEGKPNLYSWTGATGAVKYITTVAPFDVKNYGEDGGPGLANWAVSLEQHYSTGGRVNNHTRANPSGTVFAFESTAQLTSFDNHEARASDCHYPELGKEPCPEIYRYDTENGEFGCISCSSATGPATGEARFQTFHEVINAATPAQSVTNDGEEIIFESTEDLVRRDRNETKDVYRWKKGAGLALISTGHNFGPSDLFAMTPDGHDVIFATHQALLPEDENGATTRLYDARVDGGFPPPESTVTEPCSNDVCQGAPSAAPEEPQLSSSSINGRGNASGKLRCGKGLRRRVRHGKEACVRRQRHHRRHHKGHRRKGRGAAR